jgi:hypothetical protein
MLKGKAEPTQEMNTWKGLYMYRLWPYPHTLDKAGKACQGQTLFLQRPSNKMMILEALNNEGG